MIDCKIVKMELWHIKMPMKFSFQTGFGSIDSRDTIIVKLTTSDGLVGYGESAALAEPIYLEESIPSVLAVSSTILKSVVLRQPINPESFYCQTKKYRGNKIAKFGIECALWSIQSQLAGRSLSSLLGGTKKYVPVGESIGLQPSLSSYRQIIQKRIAEGYRRIKIKIEPGRDVKLVQYIRHHFPNIQLMVDANSSYALKDIAIFKQLDEYHLMMIEQPLGFDDLYQHSQLQKQIRTPICLDESITSSDKAAAAIEMGACRIINVKPGRIGSLIETKQINQLAKKHHIPLWCGGMLESSIAIIYNLAAASLSQFTLPADFSSPDHFFHASIVSPNIVADRNGRIAVPTDIGLGHTVNEDLLLQMTERRYEIN